MDRWKVADRIAVAFGFCTAPVLRYVSRNRMALPRFQRFSDGAGFQVRSTHYYDPTYAEQALPADTTRERNLPGIDLNEAGQLALLRQFTFQDELRAIPRAKRGPAEFGYDNIFYGAGDAEIYYNMIRLKRPRRIVEIGSGNSTLMALLAIRANQRDDPGYACQVECIEPYEMAWLESVGVTVIRERVETIALSFFDRLEPGDILFIDSSHVIRPYGDVLREFQEILPALKPGVLIHVHDIFTPRDYPELWLRQQRRLWNEQYLLECFLYRNDRFRIVSANNWLRHNHWDAFSAACPMTGAADDPSGFWMEVTGA